MGIKSPLQYTPERPHLYRLLDPPRSAVASKGWGVVAPPPSSPSPVVFSLLVSVRPSLLSPLRRATLFRLRKPKMERRTRPAATRKHESFSEKQSERRITEGSQASPWSDASCPISDCPFVIRHLSSAICDLPSVIYLPPSATPARPVGLQGCPISGRRYSASGGRGPAAVGAQRN